MTAKGEGIADVLGSGAGRDGPRVTVVIATHDRAPLLPEAIRSVQAQSIADWDCVVADDGSTDDTERTLQGLKQQEPRLRSVRLAHSGRHGRVRNAAVAASVAPFVAFLDDDDRWLPVTLESQLAAFADAPDAALVCGRVRRFGDRSGLWPARPQPARLDLARLLRGNVIPLSTVMVRRAAFVQAGGFPPETEATPDYELWLRLARVAPIRCLPDVLCDYRVHAGSMSRRKALEIEELEDLYARLEREWELPTRMLVAARRGLSRARARGATSLGTALGHWLRALRP
jgi:glycosyltransferase involved in cell wall biosynthesis